MTDTSDERVPLLQHPPIRLIHLSQPTHIRRPTYYFDLPHALPSPTWLTFREEPPDLSLLLARYQLPPFPSFTKKHVYYTTYPTKTGPVHVLSTPDVRHMSTDTLHLTHISDINIPLHSSCHVLRSVLDHLVHAFHHQLQALSESLTSIEERLLASPSPIPLDQILKLHVRIALARHFYPSLLQVLNRVDSNHILKDPIHAHLSFLKGASNGLLEIVLSLQNNRMQETMQTLAVITTMFVPLTFLAGIEGMNFANMPELRLTGGYVGFWVIVCMVFAAQIVFFKRKRWI